MHTKSFNPKDIDVILIRAVLSAIQGPIQMLGSLDPGFKKVFVLRILRLIPLFPLASLVQHYPKNFSGS